MQEIYQKVSGVTDAVNAELAEFDQQLSLEALGEIGSLVIIRTWQLKREAVWQEQMQPIQEFTAEKTKQMEYFCSQVLQSPEADRKMAEAFVADIRRRRVGEELALAAEEMELDIAKNQKQLSRGSIEGSLDDLLGSDDLDRQEEYIRNPVRMLEQELAQRVRDIVDVDAMKKDMTSKLRAEFRFLRCGLQGLRDTPELQPEKASAQQLMDAEDFANNPSETDNAQKQTLSRWTVSYLTIDDVLPSRWSVDENGQPVVCDDQTDNAWQVKASQALPCTGSPVPDKFSFLKKSIAAPCFEPLKFFFKI